MPLDKYLKITIGDNQIEVRDPKELPISIDYTREDPEDFQSKKSSEAFDVEIPATLINDVAANTLRNFDIEDFTSGKIFRGNQPCVIESNSAELLVGKAFLKSASFTDRPINYIYNLYGDNADWIVELRDKTLYDFLSHINFSFTKTQIIDSWDYDGTDSEMPFVFAPVKFLGPMGGYIPDPNGEAGRTKADDENMLPTYMRPSLSKYWILFWALKSVGYKINSQFLNTSYFRRQVMPWTWGNFLDSDGTRLTAHTFVAMSTGDCYWNGTRDRQDVIVDFKVSNDSTDGGVDANDDYHYDDVTYEMIWEYKSNQDFGPLEATFSLQFEYDARVEGDSDMTLTLEWLHMRSVVEVNTKAEQIFSIAIFSSSISEQGLKTFYYTSPVPVEANDIVIARIRGNAYRSKQGDATMRGKVLSFKLEYFKIPVGGLIDFANFTGLKNYNIIDFIAGLIDEFDLSVNTDSISKVVTIEPTHPYSLGNDLSVTSGGYMKEDFVDWDGKEDLSKAWGIDNYSDSERELVIQYKGDSNDGILKVIQDRNINTLAAGKYVFPSRFASGKKDRENRFFSATMQYEVDQWKDLGIGDNLGIAPQMVCIIPENVSNTSNSEAANTFNPKSCYYKGLVSGAGAWRFDGDVLQDYPFMFSVNYKDGGEDDPILSYSDEKIKSGSGFVIGKGLLKRFYWQRLAIIRNGQWLNCWFRLNNYDVAGQLHREYKSFKGQRWELIQIKGYKPLLEESTGCLMYKWAPVDLDDFNNTFPSSNSVLNGVTSGSLDIKYAQLKCLITDIPKK